MWLENNINNRMKELERIISEKEKALACAPEGALKIHARKGGDRYYMVMEANSDGIYRQPARNPPSSTGGGMNCFLQYQTKYPGFGKGEQNKTIKQNRNRRNTCSFSIAMV